MSTMRFTGSGNRQANTQAVTPPPECPKQAHPINLFSVVEDGLKIVHATRASAVVGGQKDVAAIMAARAPQGGIRGFGRPISLRDPLRDRCLGVGRLAARRWISPDSCCVWLRGGGGPWVDVFILLAVPGDAIADGLGGCPVSTHPRITSECA